MTGAVDLSGLKQRPAAAAGGAKAGQHTVEITEANLETDVLVRSGQVPVVVLLWSARSQACLKVLDALDALATADAGKWVLATVDVDAAPRVGAMFGVEAVPTVVALAGGQPLSSFEGPQPPDELRRWIDSLLSATAGKLGGGTGEAEPAVDPALTDARDKLDSGDFAAAAAAYQGILDADPNHAEAKGARCARSRSWCVRRRIRAPRWPMPTPRPTTSTPRSPRPTSRCSATTRRRRSTGSSRW